MLLLVVNAGSSNVKLAVFEAAEMSLHRRARGQAKIAGDGVELRMQADGSPAFEARAAGDRPPHEVVLDLLDRSWPLREFDAAGQRIVHGGGRYDAPQRLDRDTRAVLRGFAELAPLHQPANLDFVDAVAARRPELPQVGCFDTAFHAGLPAVARRFALPRRFEAQGIRRYGFHGLSYQSILRQLRERAPALAAGRVVVAHLGAGASLCAMRDGRSIDTSMGFSALDGLPMATRCGALDPGVVLHFIRRLGMTAEAVESMLYRESGLLGVSGESADMRDLQASGSETARAAIELFVHRVATGIGAGAVALGGLDGVVFTGGIGENQPPIRAAVAERLTLFGARTAEEANAGGNGPIHAHDSGIELWALRTDEEAEIARGTLDAL